MSILNLIRPRTKLDLEIENQKKRGVLTVISGPAGAGKDTTVDGLRQKFGFGKIVTCTTREKRANEKEGKDYHFISKEEFKKKINQNFFLEWEKYLNNFYGTPKNEVLKNIKKGVDVLLRVDVRGAKSVKREIPEAVLVYLSAPSFKILGKRMKRRKELQKSIDQRLQVAAWEVEQFEGFDYLVVNEENKIEKTVKLVKMIIETERRRIKNGKK